MRFNFKGNLFKISSIFLNYVNANKRECGKENYAVHFKHRVS